MDKRIIIGLVIFIGICVMITKWYYTRVDGFQTDEDISANNDAIREMLLDKLDVTSSDYTALSDSEKLDTIGTLLESGTIDKKQTQDILTVKLTSLINDGIINASSQVAKTLILRTGDLDVSLLSIFLLSFYKTSSLSNDITDYADSINPSFNVNWFVENASKLVTDNIATTTVSGNIDISDKNEYKYLSGNADVQYHDSVNAILAQTGTSDSINMKYMTVKDQTGNTISIPVPAIQGSVTYYEPGSYRFGASSYVPNYADSIYLRSNVTGLPVVTPVSDSSNVLAGFCIADKEFPNKLEEKCRATVPKNCASNSCCVLLGGGLCVAGDSQGPTDKTNYSNYFIKNRDFYYYQGKCYGNCN